MFCHLIALDHYLNQCLLVDLSPVKRNDNHLGANWNRPTSRQWLTSDWKWHTENFNQVFHGPIRQMVGMILRHFAELPVHDILRSLGKLITWKKVGSARKINNYLKVDTILRDYVLYHYWHDIAYFSASYIVHDNFIIQHVIKCNTLANYNWQTINNWSILTHYYYVIFRKASRTPFFSRSFMRIFKRTFPLKPK